MERIIQKLRNQKELLQDIISKSFTIYGQEKEELKNLVSRMIENEIDFAQSDPETYKELYEQ